MNRRHIALTFALAGAVLLTSCSLLRQQTMLGDETPKPFALPTTTATPKRDEVLPVASFGIRGPCAILTMSGKPELLPIWPKGYTAMSGPMYFLLTPPDGSQDVVDSEMMEVHGEYLDSPPADAVIPPECAKYPLYLVSKVINRS